MSTKQTKSCLFFYSSVTLSFYIWYLLRLNGNKFKITKLIPDLTNIWKFQWIVFKTYCLWCLFILFFCRFIYLKFLRFFFQTNLMSQQRSMNRSPWLWKMMDNLTKHKKNVSLINKFWGLKSKIKNRLRRSLSTFCSLLRTPLTNTKRLTTFYQFFLNLLPLELPQTALITKVFSIQCLWGLKLGLISMKNKRLTYKQCFHLNIKNSQNKYVTNLDFVYRWSSEKNNRSLTATDVTNK